MTSATAAALIWCRPPRWIEGRMGRRWADRDLRRSGAPLFNLARTTAASAAASAAAASASRIKASSAGKRSGMSPLWRLRAPANSVRGSPIVQRQQHVQRPAHGRGKHRRAPPVSQSQNGEAITAGPPRPPPAAGRGLTPPPSRHVRAAARPRVSVLVIGINGHMSRAGQLRQPNLRQAAQAHGGETNRRWSVARVGTG